MGWQRDAFPGSQPCYTLSVRDTEQLYMVVGVGYAGEKVTGILSLRSTHSLLSSNKPPYVTGQEIVGMVWNESDSCEAGGSPSS